MFSLSSKAGTKSIKFLHLIHGQNRVIQQAPLKKKSVSQQYEETRPQTMF